MAPRGKKILQYAPEDMNNALDDVRRGMSVAAAALKNGVPRITLLYKVKGKYPEERKMGPPSTLSKEEENLIVKWIKHMASVGFPVARSQVLDSVQHILKGLNRENPFQDDRPGRKWFQLFIKRNPGLSFRTPENLTTSRASVTEENLQQWFSNVYSSLEEKNLHSILDDPSRVFNADESAFFLNPKGNKVLAGKGDKNVYQRVNPDEKECLTVLLSASAAGVFSPPSIIFKYERIPSDIAFSIPKSWGIGRSETGWMNGSIFFEYLANVFHPWLIIKQIPLPVILFLDGHSSHLTMHSSQFCDDNGIILIALYPNATHLLQPLDVSVFRALKLAWKKKVHEWRIMNVKDPILKKKHFAPLLEEAIRDVPPSAITNGFKKCGLVPWNPDTVYSSIAIQDRKGSISVPNANPKDSPRLRDTKTALRVIEEAIGPEKAMLLKNSESWPDGDEGKSLYDLWWKLDQTVQILSLLPHDIQSAPVIIDEGNALGGETCENQDITNIQPLFPQHISPQIHYQNETTFESTSNITILPETPLNDFPSPFKKALPWPGPAKKKPKRVSYPGFVISESWREYNKKRELKKQEEEEKKRKRAEERLRKKLEKEELLRNKTKGKKAARVGKRNRRNRKEPSSSTEEEWFPSAESEVECSESEASVEVGHQDGGKAVHDHELEEVGGSLDVSLISNTTGERQTIPQGFKIPHSEKDVKNFEERAEELQPIIANPPEEPNIKSNEESVQVPKTIENVELPSTLDNAPKNNTLMRCNNFTGHNILSSENSSHSIDEKSYLIISMRTTRKSRRVYEALRRQEDGKLRAFALKPVNRMRNIFMKSENRPRILEENLINIEEKLSPPLVFGTGLNVRYQFSDLINVNF